MFTGIIEDVGRIKLISDSKIEVETKLDDISKGGSIAVNGICLTAVKLTQNSFFADYSPNTDKITNFSKLQINSKVNLERALKLSSRLGGHIVSGHVDGTASIKKIEKQNNFYKFSFACGKNILKFCVDKGSIAIDGISLTISKVFSDYFEVFVIPETFNNTAIAFKSVGSAVNIENDILAKYIERFSNKKANDISFEILERSGFTDEK
ncbi:MAG: riboflavin synthase [Elusimicrobiota bacterium]|jgi:riboflavin synthase|nr:riboflavin synthase [Elusimicrobiota bacterium]